MLVGLAETFGDFTAAIDEAARLLGACGRVRPATTEPVVLKAHVDGGGVDDAVEGQVAVANAPGRIRRVELVPSDAQAHPDAVAAIAAADIVVLAPGSLFTSLLPVLVVPELREAIAATSGMVVQVCNLRRQVPETQELDGTDHLRAVLDHGGRVDCFVYERGGPLACDADAITALGVRPIEAVVGDPARDGARSGETGESVAGSTGVRLRANPWERGGDDSSRRGQRLRKDRSVLLPGDPRSW